MQKRKRCLFFTVLMVALPAAALGQTVPPATPEEEARLIGVLQSNASLKEKVDACRGLAVVGTKRAVPVLASLLGDERLSHMARYGLEPIPDPSVDEAFRDALKTLKGKLLVGVIGSVGVRRDKKAVPLLVPLLADRDAMVVQGAARALGRIASSEAAEALREALGKASAENRPALADACLACAEKRLAEGQRDDAVALYRAVGKAELPKHFRIAAAQGVIKAQRAAGAP